MKEYSEEELNQKIINVLKLHGHSTAKQICASLNWSTSLKMKKIIRRRLICLQKADVLKIVEKKNPVYQLLEGW